MSSFTISWSSFALRCLDEIFEYIKHEAKSDIPAKKFIAKVLKRTDQLEHHPLSGQKEPLLIETGQESRYLVIASYKIIYQVEGNRVIITDVFHTSQDPSKMRRRKK